MLQVANPVALRVTDFAVKWKSLLSKLPEDFSKKLLLDCCLLCPCKKDIFESNPTYKVGVALSGGSDSTALAFLALNYFGRERVTFFTIDHNIKLLCTEPIPEIVALAKQQLGKCYIICLFPIGCDINHQVLKLHWDESIESNIKVSHLQNEGRNKRYQALHEQCKQLSLSFMLLGHNFDDDFLTSCHRLARFSCIDGLAGMKYVSTFPFATESAFKSFMARPFLDVTKVLKNKCIIN